ncbi:PqqD family protein [Cereibacter sphaeroides]|uniref:PqqD family protein n=1 Tax=Rhodobacterales TaxID=204455 RepID=UPI000BBECE47|nr:MULTISPECIES: PqqD family protein [Paracoccaceae]MCE6953349.1 PqqD family protein [Cereibacter sphaeroides]MCE6960330.1 PqqD family protein [Cereibacter sphaeroides]MCE6969279.1 PqqD family protein [Cereibacter sphaeroides]MCE6975338.1 PqqD family protein [Cereibacter sphaeroides]
MTIRAASGCIPCAFGDGIAIFDTNSNSYYSMNSVGEFVWSMLDRPVTLAEIVDRVAERYRIDHERCEGDIRRLVDDLAANRLVTLT